MRKYSAPLLASFILLVVFSCNKDKSNQLFLWVEPVTTLLEVKNGDKVPFTITASSDYGNLISVKISEKKANDFFKVLADSAPGRKKVKWLYEYEVPAMDNADELLNLFFEATDDQGNKVSAARVLHIKTEGADKPEETSGHIIYSAASGDLDAFCFYGNQVLNSAYSDTALLHIMDASLPGSQTLSRKWVSPAGLKFVRFNDLDFGNTSKSAIKIAYENGIKRDFVENLTEGDIVLCKIEEQTEPLKDSLQPIEPPIYFYAAVKLVYIIDNNGTNNTDRYVFSVKK
jgi:hypothetical protein